MPVFITVYNTYNANFELEEPNGTNENRTHIFWGKVWQSITNKDLNIRNISIHFWYFVWLPIKKYCADTML